MSKTKSSRRSTPVDQPLDPEVIAFRQPVDDQSPLDQLVREGARRMLQEAIDAEVEAFVEANRHRRNEQGRRLVVKNGSLPEREILTGTGPIPVRQGRVRDNSADPTERVEFTPSILPTYLRRTETTEELIPWLYLKGISTGDFGEALQALVGERAKGLSPNVIVRTPGVSAHQTAYIGNQEKLHSSNLLTRHDAEVSAIRDRNSGVLHRGDREASDASTNTRACAISFIHP